MQPLFNFFMVTNRLFPDYIFESSWEVCNKVGGIYAVLSTRAKTLKEAMGDRLIFIGPDCWGKNECPYFVEDDAVLPEWREKAVSEGLAIKVGRWNVPGNPIAVLVDFSRYYAKKDAIYAALWNDFGVDSLHAYGDYDEASMFSYAAALVVESLYKYVVKPNSKVVYHGNEWMTGLGLLYIHKHQPEIATIFTTHATSIGRSISGNNKPLYGYLSAYNGNQMAAELNMQSKHSIERETAANVDCFTTVSDITARECQELLDKPADVVLPNGFEDDFVPQGRDFTKKRKEARKRLIGIANALTGCDYGDDVLIVSTSGRYEFRNKGIDVFVESMHRLNEMTGLKRQVLAFVAVPGWVNCPRHDLAQRIGAGEKYDTQLERPVITHWLNDMDNDRVLGQMRYLNMNNAMGDNVKVFFIPCYLTGDDGILNLTYFDAILGNDLCVYPSYYEPWGYTPLEAVAFKVPCITTDLAGFGVWASQELKGSTSLKDGVLVVHRTDDNYNEVVDNIKEAVYEYAALDAKQTTSARNKARKLSQKALWSNFIKYYCDAYDFALRKMQERTR